MKRRFRSKRKRNNIIRLIIYALLIYLLFYIVFIKFNQINYKKFNKNIFNIGINNINIKNKLKKSNIFYLSLNSYLKPKSYKTNLDLVKVKDNIDNPLIYIYNTHQSEEYDRAFNEAYNISYTTWTASYILKDYLKEYGIDSIVEENSINDYLKTNNLSYSKSYDVSRIYVNEKLKKYPSIKYIIDLHRDSLSKDKTTITIDNINYAKIKFVIGLDNINYNDNLNFASKLSSELGLISGGIIQKGGKGVNGVYNQDLSSNLILIEVGGVYNNIEEVSASLRVLSNILYKEINNER